MPRYVVKATVKVRQQADGSWLATSVSPPVLVVSPDRESLDEKVEGAIQRLMAELSRRRPEGQTDEAFLDELGVAYEWESGDETTLTVRVPVPA